jgi:hypothetical protein
MKLILENPKPLQLEHRLDPVIAGLHGAARSPAYYSFSGDPPWCVAADPLAAITELQVAFDEYVATLRGLIDEEIARLTPKPVLVVDELATAIAEGKTIAEKIAALTAKVQT